VRSTPAAAAYVLPHALRNNIHPLQAAHAPAHGYRYDAPAASASAGGVCVAALQALTAGAVCVPQSAAPASSGVTMPDAVCVALVLCVTTDAPVCTALSVMRAGGGV
jgi:hypothetical protein